MVDENKRFVEEFANPHSWLMMADNLHEQATEIYRGRSRSSIMTKVDSLPKTGVSQWSVGDYRLFRAGNDRNQRLENDG